MKTNILLAILLTLLNACSNIEKQSDKQAIYKPDSTVYNMHRAMSVEKHDLIPVYVLPDLDIYSVGDTVRITLTHNLVLPANSIVGPSSPVVIGRFIRQVKIPVEINY
jgi:hypothetical protein